MKKTLLIALLALISSLSFGQQGFPVSTQFPSTIEDHALLEGTKTSGEMFGASFVVPAKTAIMLYGNGVNDATGATTDEQFGEALDNFIKLRNRQAPGAPILFVGPSPLNNNTHETRLAQLRTIMAGKANTGQKIYYVSLASAFDRTVTSNYANTDGVHPNLAQQTAMATIISNYITANITF